MLPFNVCVMCVSIWSVMQCKMSPSFKKNTSSRGSYFEHPWNHQSLHKTTPHPLLQQLRDAILTNSVVSVNNASFLSHILTSSFHFLLVLLESKLARSHSDGYSQVKSFSESEMDSKTVRSQPFKRPALKTTIPNAAGKGGSKVKRRRKGTVEDVEMTTLRTLNAYCIGYIIYD